MFGPDVAAVDVVEVAVQVSAHTGNSHCRASRGATRLTQLMTPMWQAPTACVFDSTIGRLNDPASSIHVVPVISPLPLSAYSPQRMAGPHRPDPAAGSR